MVTSTVAAAASPPDRPTLASLPPINENPPAPGAVGPTQVGLRVVQRLMDRKLYTLHPNPYTLQMCLRAVQR